MQRRLCVENTESKKGNKIMFMLSIVSFIIMGSLFLWSYFSTKKSEQQFKDNQYRTEGIVFGKNIKMNGPIMKVRLKFLDRDGQEWKCISNSFCSTKEKFEPETIMTILFAERKTRFGTRPEARVIDKRYVMKPKRNALNTVRTLSILCFAISIALTVVACVF